MVESSFQVGQSVSHYRIVDKIGAGGMGEVYRATDTRLGRDVALKVMPADMARDADRLARFQREARSVAALNHPHIVTIYSVEEIDGIHFLTMELVEGQSLDRLIPASGLAVEQIVEIASALADALAAAHEKGIVHRDLKPANVMITTDGRVKVLDFGLAKDVSASETGAATLTSAGLTQAGLVMGTPAYMSPEQIAGRAVDHRTDIFSLGVVLHEMVTGRRPFEGTSLAELTSAILRDTPASISEIRTDLPSDLVRITRRCLEKDPRHRVQTARDVSNEFRDLARQTPQKVSPVTPPPSRAAAASNTGTSRTEDGFWVAVLPFKYKGPNADLTALAEGLTEDIVTGMSRFSYLKVVAHSATSRYNNDAVDARAAAKELGAHYVMEGTLRQAGSKLRIMVQLIDVTSGAHLWAETYIHPFNPETLFELQDELVPRIVSTVADTRGVLPHTMSEALRSKVPDQLTPYEALLRSFAYFQRINAEEHGVVRTALERAVQQAPGFADAWAILSIIYREEYTHNFNLLPDPLGRAFQAARRATEAAPSNHYGYHALASVVFFRQERQAFESAAERAVLLNPMDGFTLAYMGSLFAYSGNWERGCALSQQARSLNPHHPGWYWFVPVYDAYNKRDYRTARDIALKVNMPGFWRTHFTLAAAYGQLGELDLARSAVRELLAIRPDFPATVRTELEKWHYPELVEHLLDGWRKASLEIADEPGETGSLPAGASAHNKSGAVRADEGFWVAVLPFKHGGGSADLTALADGLSEEIVTGLSRFSYLRVIARGSTLQYANQAADLRTVGRELGARYVVEGSIRQAGTRLRVAVQLVDAITGTHLWAETYDRAFHPEHIFELQDDLVPRIVSTVADHEGVLPQSMAELLRTKSEDQLTPHEALLRSFRFFKALDPEEVATAKRILENTVRNAPNHGDCWAMLSHMYCNDYWYLRDPRPECLDRALAAARRAVDVAPSNHLSYWALALALYFKGDFPAARLAADRSIEINRMDGSAVAFMGALIALTGEWERGSAIAEPASALNPNHAGWHRCLGFLNAYRKRDYQEALAVALRLDMQGHFLEAAFRAAVYGQLGQCELAHKAVHELLALRPDFATMSRPFCERWLGPEYTEHLIEGWRKAGLEIAPKKNSGSAMIDPPRSTSSATAGDSGATRADEGFWVAVLPFKYSGNTAELTALAEGLTEDIVRGLSRFSYLRVIARGSTVRYANQAADSRTVGNELGARYVMEGSLRQAGAKLRVAVRLVDATSGAHLWAENYERNYSPEAVFELQDDLVPRIVSTVADMNGVLPRSMSETVRGRKPEELSPYEAVLRSFSYFERVTPEDLAAARFGLELAVQKASAYADAWAMLALLYVQDYAQGFSLQADSLASGSAAARHAVEAAPSSHLAYFGLAQALFFQKEFQSFRNAADHALALNPMDGNSIALLGEMIAYSGDWDFGLELAERARQLNPNHPGWYWHVNFNSCYRQGDYSGALNFARKMNVGNNWGAHALMAAACGQLGAQEAARKSVGVLLKLRPHFTATVRRDLEKWWGPDYAEHLIEGWRKAGLEIAGPENEAPKTAASS